MKIIDKPSLPREIFQVEVAPQLLAQAVRVYLANQRQGTQNAKTRAEVNRTRHKLYKQKGTGGARHGDRKAPIFVGGGVTFAPKQRDYSLSLSKEMKKKALFGALSTKAKDKSLIIISAMDKLTGKTKELAKFLNNQTQEPRAEKQGKKAETGRWLIITDQARENVYRAGRNIPGVTILPANQLNTYQVLKANRILMMEEALSLINPVKPIKAVKVLTPLAKKVRPSSQTKTAKTKKTAKTAKKVKT